MSQTTQYLKEFARAAGAFLKKESTVKDNYDYFQAFVKKQNLERATWKDFQHMGEHIYALSKFALAKQRAFGNPNHPLQHYRDSFLYLVYGRDPIETRIDKFANSAKYGIKYLGSSAISEIVAYIFADQYVMFNQRDEFGMRLLGIDYDKKGGFPKDFFSFNEALKPLVEEYKKEVGRKTDWPLHFEIDQFLSYLYVKYGDQPPPDEPAKARYWIFAPGERARYWEEQYENGEMAMGWDELGDLGEYQSKEDIRRKLKKLIPSDTDHRLGALACFNFANVMKVGDYVFAKKGIHLLIGYGQVASDYTYDASRNEYKHVRKVRWLRKGSWEIPEGQALVSKTLTDLTPWPEYVGKLKNVIGIEAPPLETQKNYWWITANPDIWDPRKDPLHHKQFFDSKNKRGNKRRIFKRFSEVKPGDLVLCYIARPVFAISSIYQVTAGLHDTSEGEGFEIEKIEQLANPLPLGKIQEIPALKSSEPLANHCQGTLFRLDEGEYRAINEIIRLDNPSRNPEYPLSALAEAAGFEIELLKRWVNSIERKGQAIIFGPPGTGKTYVAELLAKHLIGGGDGFYDFVQFHPSYSYEDFIQGIRPTTGEVGNIVYPMISGRFLDFRQKASGRRGRCVLIVDEINRANLSRVFGELMYLLEYRDRTVQLSSGGELSIPSNLRIIGTMNTADRSIALVDHALRRRFAFLALYPQYEVLRRFHQDSGFPVDKLVEVLRDVNRQIADKHYEVGITYFLTESLRSSIADIWRMEIEPYLDEYFFDQPDKADQFTWDKIKDKLAP